MGETFKEIFEKTLLEKRERLAEKKEIDIELKNKWWETKRPTTKFRNGGGT
jgi:hypothetical protein